MISMASAFEFDNVKDYDPITREVTITNAYGVGDEIGKARLNTPLNVKIAPGYQKVAEFDIWAYGDYNDALKQFTFTNMKTKQKINREFDMRYLTYEDVEVEDYGQECYIDYSNSTNGTEACSNFVSGHHLESREKWVKVTPANLKKNEMLTIGIFTDVRIGDYVDWIPTIYGVEVEEWATWTADINSNALAYYRLNLTSGDVEDIHSTHEGSIVGGVTRGVTGQIGNAFSFDGSADVYVNSNHKFSNEIANSDFWINSWYFEDGSVAGNIFHDYGASGNKGFYLWKDSFAVFGATTQIGVSISETATTGWHMVTGVRKSDRIEIYLDSVLNTTIMTTTGTIAQSQNNGVIGCSSHSFTSCFDSDIDELLISTGTPTQEVLDFLWNNGTGLTYADDGFTDEAPIVILNLPLDNANFTSDPTTINFSCNASDDINLTNVKLIINGAINGTNASGINNSQYTFERSLPEGGYTWTCEATDNNSVTTTASNRTFFVHNTPPSVDITFPTGNLGFNAEGDVTILNWTIGETGQNLTTHIVNCSYTYNDIVTIINNTVCTVLNETTFLYVGGINTITLNVTDEFGFVSTDTNTWEIDLTQISESFFSPVVEGSTTPITANVSLKAGLRISSVVLNYNGTEFPGSNVEYATDTYFLSISKSVPSVEADTNITFYWNVTLEDGSALATDSNNQTILNLSIDDCSVFTNTIFNFTMVDEATQILIPGAAENTSLKIDMTLSSPDLSTQVIQFSEGFSEINPAAVCLNNEMGNSTLRLDAVIEYSAADKFVEFYNIQNFDFDETTASQNITLFNLEESEGLAFKVVYKGQDFIPVGDIVLQIQRKYIDEGVFKTIEIPMSGSNAYTIAHLVPNDVIYNLIFLQNGSVLDTFTEIVADCQNPTIIECEINLNALITGTNLFNIVEEDDFFSSLSFDKTTREVSATYGIISGASGLTSLNVTLIDNFGNNTACSDSLVAAGGTLSCIVPSSFGDSVVYARVILNDEPRREGYISMKENPKDQFAGILIFISIILLLFIFGIGVSDSPGLTGIFFILGALLLTGLNVFYSTSWIGAGATILWFIVAVILVIVKGGSKR